MLRVNYENHKDLVSYGVKTVSESPALQDCLVLCSNGKKEVNSLILGLLFPVLGQCEVFNFPVSQTVILQEVKILELENLIKKLENSLSRVKCEPVEDEDEYIEEVDNQEAIPDVDQNDHVNQELIHIFGAEILNTLDLEQHHDPDDPQKVCFEKDVEPLKKKEQSCPVESCSKKFQIDKLLKLHMKNSHSSPKKIIKNVHLSPGKPPGTPSPTQNYFLSPSKASSLNSSPTSSPLKFYSPIKHIIPVQALFKCEFQGCGKTFLKQVTFLKHRGTHKNKPKLSTKENVLEQERPINDIRPQVSKQVMPVSVMTQEVEMDLDQFYQENDILGEQFSYQNDKKQYRCLFDKCRTEFTYRHELRSHYIDHDVTEFMCPECDIKFDIKTSLNEHRFKAHHILTVNKDICPFCDALFFTKESFRNHVLAKHRGPWQCDSCNEKFFTMNEFKQHMLDHTETNLTCDWPNCNIIFSKRDQLKAHLSSHETEEFYTCPNYLCSFFFCTLQGFEKHMKVHEHEDSFDCIKCNKEYYNMRQFECHIEAGHMQNPKAYEFASEVNLNCPFEECKRSFVQEKWLQKHLKTHIQNEHGSNQKSRRSRTTAFKVIKVQKSDNKPVKVLEPEQPYNDANSVFFRMEST